MGNLDDKTAIVTGAGRGIGQVEQFNVLPAFRLPDSDVLTPTMMLQRTVIAEKYVTEIEEIYSRPARARTDAEVSTS